MNTISITLEGLIPSKKNSQEIRRIKRNGKMVPFISPSKKYLQWNSQAQWEIAAQIPNMDTPIEAVHELLITVYFPTMSKADTINKAEGILDTLVDAGVILDDNYHVLPNVVLLGRYRKGRAGAEITINY